MHTGDAHARHERCAFLVTSHAVGEEGGRIIRPHTIGRSVTRPLNVRCNLSSHAQTLHALHSSRTRRRRTPAPFSLSWGMCGREQGQYRGR